MDIEAIGDTIFKNSQNENKIKAVFIQQKEDFPQELEGKVLKSISLYFLDPSLPCRQVMQFLDSTVNEVKEIHRWLRNSATFQSLITSDYYPLAIMMRYAREMTRDFIENPRYFQNVIDGIALSPKRLEIHVTEGTCNYKCRMCLWRVGRDQPDYDPEEINEGPLSIEKWNQTLSQAYALGTKTIIFSGGGEPSLRTEGFKTLAHIRRLKLKSMIYTNGFHLLEMARSGNPLYDEYLRADWLRISAHAATNSTYSKLTGLPGTRNNLNIVKSGIKRLIQDRNSKGTRLKIGLGFVIQDLSYKEVEKFAEMAHQLGVDFLNIRADCVDITRRLTIEEQSILFNQLRRIRTNYAKGLYGTMFVDFADNLIAPMNGWSRDFTPKQTNICRVYLYRAAINPFGRMAICDLMAEPHYSCTEFTMGFLQEKEYAKIIEDCRDRKFYGNRCTACMPGQRSINTIYEKLIEDAKIGIMPEDQYFTISR